MSDKDLTEYRLDKLEELTKEQGGVLTDIVKSLAILQTKMYFIGVGIATVVSIVVPLVTDFIKG